MDEAKRTNGELRVDLLHQCTDGSDLEADCGETAAECLEAAPWVPLHKRSDEEIAASVVAGPIGPIVLQRNREIVLIARESQKWVRTNAEGKEILDRCNRINTVREIADELTLIYDIPHEVALASCINVIRGGLATGYLWDTGHKTRLDLWLHVTDACNMRCPFCFRGDPQPSLTHPEMTVEGWSRVLDGLRAFPAVKVTISGGEPTLFPDLEALLDVLNSKPNVSGIFLLTSKRTGDWRRRSRLSRCLWTVPGPRRTISFAARGISRAWRPCCANCRRRRSGTSCWRLPLPASTVRTCIR
jgi:hypothetical protein